MDSDSALSALALTVSLVFFIGASLGEASLASVRRERVQKLVADDVPGAATLDLLWSGPMGPAGSLSVTKFLALSSSLLSAASLVLASSSGSWILVPPVSAGLALVLGAVHTLSRPVAYKYGEGIALRIALPVRVLSWLLGPVLKTEAAISRRPHGNGVLETDSAQEAVPADLGLALDPDGEPLDEREMRMIRGVVLQDKTTAREIMVPRVDIVAMEIGTSRSELADRMVETGHSRVPVFNGSLDHIEGVAHARDILRVLSRDDSASTVVGPDLLRPALFIPESKSLRELLDEFQTTRVHMAIVIDEYGGVSGLVTIEDLLEEIVGEIRDEFDVGEAEIQRVADSEFMIDARVSIDDLKDLLAVDLEGDGFDTLGGFVYDRLGKIPSAGDIVEYDGLRIEVVTVVGRRLKKLRVLRTASPAATESKG